MVQEQHPDRTALYRQWRGLDWPIFVDALNLLDHKVVPIVMALDESGRVVQRLRRPQQLADFLARPAAEVDAAEAPMAMPHPLAGDALFFAGDLDAAIAAYAEEPQDDARAHFRRGVALRRRAEGAERRAGDAQSAVDAWERALALDPSQYIWRRRIQQYGPSLNKPYNMYGWVAEAREQIRARGEQPLALAVEPRGTELIGRPREMPPAVQTDPDPEGVLPRDEESLVEAEVLVVPPRVRPGQNVRVRVTFRVGEAWWNNEVQPLSLTGDVPEGWVLALHDGVHPGAEEAETREERILEYELQVPEDAAAGELTLEAYAVYNVCEDAGGTCMMLRQDLTALVVVDPDAPKIQ